MSPSAEVQPRPWRLIILAAVVIAVIALGVSFVFGGKPKPAAAPTVKQSPAAQPAETAVGDQLGQIDQRFSTLPDQDFAESEFDDAQFSG